MAGDLVSKKQKIRKHFLNVRDSLDKEVVEEKSEQIFKKIVHSSSYQHAEYVHTYVAIEKNNEVNTIPFIKRCFEDQKKVVVPKMYGEGKLSHIHLYSIDDLKENNWGVLEPVTTDSIPVTKLDLIIIPMVAGDVNRNRLGYGKGYYDRFLSECNGFKAGVLFDCQIFDNKLPVESFDVSLDILVTESRRIE